MGAHHGPKKGKISITDDARTRIVTELRRGTPRTAIAERFQVRLERVTEIAFEAGLAPEPRRRTRESIERMARRQVVEVVDTSKPRTIEELESALAALRGGVVDPVVVEKMQQHREAIDAMAADVVGALRGEGR